MNLNKNILTEGIFVLEKFYELLKLFLIYNFVHKAYSSCQKCKRVLSNNNITCSSELVKKRYYIEAKYNII